MDFLVADAASEHIDAIEELEKQCFSVPWTREQLLSQLPDERHEFLVALCEGQPVGYVGRMCVLDEGYIANVAVSKDYRRRGIASCDETAVAVVEDGRKILTDQIFSQADLQAVYGGVVPEIASRCHVESISILAQRAIERAGITRADIDAVAVTYAPGLIGAVLVGVNFAKACALALGVPLIPVHHIRGHIAANYLAYPELEPPFLCLAISGGNTILVDVRGYTDMKIIGATRDDAAGECFDKTARVLGLPYPGGRPMEELSKGGDD